MSAPCTKCRHCQSADALSPFILKHLPRREDAGQTHSIANGQVRHHAPQSRLCNRPRRDQRRDRLFLRRPTPPYSPRSPVLPERAPHQRQRAVRVGSGPNSFSRPKGHGQDTAFALRFSCLSWRRQCVCLVFPLPFALRLRCLSQLGHCRCPVFSLPSRRRQRLALLSFRCISWLRHCP